MQVLLDRVETMAKPSLWQDLWRMEQGTKHVAFHEIEHDPENCKHMNVITIKLLNFNDIRTVMDTNSTGVQRRLMRLSWQSYAIQCI